MHVYTPVVQVGSNLLIVLILVVVPLSPSKIACYSFKFAKLPFVGLLLFWFFALKHQYIICEISFHEFSNETRIQGYFCNFIELVILGDY